MAWYMWILIVVCVWIMATIGERISRRFATRSSLDKDTVTFAIILVIVFAVELSIAANILYKEVVYVFTAGIVTAFVQGLVQGIAVWRDWV